MNIKNRRARAISYPSHIECPFSCDHNAPAGADNCDQYPESLVRYFLENYTKEGSCVFDPFLGFGTTAFVAEEMARIPYGIEADGERFEWAAGQIEHWQNIRHGDAANMDSHNLPKMDFCITSPPYMPREDSWNPLYGGDPAHAGYDAYLDRIEFIFEKLRSLMKKDALIVVQADNLQGALYTPLVADFKTRISKSFAYEAEIIVRWSGEMPPAHEGYKNTHCLVFKKN